MATTTTDTRCWTLTDPDDELAIWEANGHFSTREKAQAHFDGLAAEGYDMTSREVTQEKAPCHTIECAAGGCDYRFDQDGDGLTHFESAEEARRWVLRCDWVDSPDGPVCQTCVEDGRYTP